MSKEKIRPLVRTLLPFVVALGVACSAAAADVARRFEIASQDLAAALNQFAVEADCQIVFAPNLVRDMRSPMVSGTYTPEEVIRLLLTGTDLSVRAVGPSTYAVEARNTQPAASKTLDKTSSSAPPPNGEDYMPHAQTDANAAAERDAQDSSPVTSDSAKSANAAARRSAYAWDQGVARESVATPEVLVAGSKILNMDIARSRDDPQPYVIFSRDKIAQSGASNLEDFLKNRLSMNMVSLTHAQEVGGRSSALGTQSTINLRGFGAGQTLILIDGRRTAGISSFGTPSQPDINGIPLAAIERIEVLPTTASAIYGGSATGGVVNIILRRDYEGAEVRATYDNSFDSGGESRRIDLSAGFNLEDGKTNVMISGSYSDANALRMKDRNFDARARALVLANRGYAGTTVYGLAPPAGSTTNIMSASGTDLTLKDGTPLNAPYTWVPEGYTGTASDAGHAFLANAGTFNLEAGNSTQLQGGDQLLLLVPETKSLTTTLRRQFSESVQGFLEGAYAQNYTENGTSPAVFNTFYNVTIPASSPINPFQQDIRVMPVTTVTQANLGYSKTQSYRAAGGVIVKLPREWMSEADYTWSRSRFSFRLADSLFTADGIAAVTSGTLDVFRDTNLYPIDLTPYIDSTRPYATIDPFVTDLKDVTLRFSGPLLHVPAGVVRATALLEHRGDQIADGSYTALGKSYFLPNRKQTVRSAYTELLVPLVSAANAHPGVRELELQISGRADWYETGGVTSSILSDTTPIQRTLNKVSSVDPTFAVRYQPIEDAAFRASYGTGFVPPAVNQLLPNAPTLDMGSVIIDRRRGNTQYVGGFTTTGGGNPDLEPENSKSWSAGIVLTPRVAPGLRLSVDWVRIEKSNIITRLAYQDLIDNESQFGSRITRGEKLPGDPADWAGPIVAIDGRLINAFTGKMEAYDAQLDYTYETDSHGTFTFYALATKLVHNLVQGTIDAPAVENAGTIDALKLKGNAGLSWSRGQWTLGWTARFFDSYYLNTAHTVNVDQGASGIPSQVYHDVFATWRPDFGTRPALDRVLSNTELSLGIRNVLNKDPPITASMYGASYSSLADPRLATYWLSVRKGF